MTIQERTEGPESLVLADTLSFVARSQVLQRRPKQAELPAKRALAIREKALGPNAPRVADSLELLAEVYRLQAQPEKAEPFARRAKGIRGLLMSAARETPPRHGAPASADGPSVASRRPGGRDVAPRGAPDGSPGLARGAPQVLAQDELAAAADQLPLQLELPPRVYQQAEEARAARTQQFVAMAETMKNRAQAYASFGRDSEAEALFQDSVAVFEDVIGRDHPGLADVLEAYAAFLEQRGEAEQARAMRLRARSVQPAR